MRGAESPSDHVYICPRAGGQHLEVLIRRDGAVEAWTAPRADVLDWAWREGEDVGVHVAGLTDRIDGTPPPFADISLTAPRIMGIINVTPDSFSDGGETVTADAALARGRAFVDAGADIVDVGGESTRPGAEPVTMETERDRVLPAVESLAADGITVSIDSRRASVIEAALAAGARIVNDVTALTGDAGSMAMVAGAEANVVLMHMQGEPATMQKDPQYVDAAVDVYDYLATRIGACEAAGIPRRRIAIDPGIGFGKAIEHNLRILSRLALFRGLGCAIVVGLSRKSFMNRLTRKVPAANRLGGSIAGGLAAVHRGAHILRVHDVAETRQALDIWQAIEAMGVDPQA